MAPATEPLPSKASKKRTYLKPPYAKNRLRELRERGREQGSLWLTLEEVAAVMGLSVAMVSRHETHERGLTDEDVEKYAALYKVKPTRIFSRLTVSR